MTYLIFAICVALLFCIASISGLTYNTVNILVYYLLIPLTWAWMADKIVRWKRPYLTVAFLICWAVVFISTIGHFQQFCDWAFGKSVDFLMWFKHWNWNYYMASVYICVWLPLAVYALLWGVLFYLHPNWKWRKWLKIIAVVVIAGFIIEKITMNYGVKLQRQSERKSYHYSLTEQERSAIRQDTKGMNTDEIVKYSMRFTCDKLDFMLAQTSAMPKGKGNCVTYAGMCCAVANHAFAENRIQAKAIHSVGTIKLFGCDICNALSSSLKRCPNKSIIKLFRDHDFVTVKTSEGNYHIDPLVKDFLGYDLKTKD